MLQEKCSAWANLEEKGCRELHNSTPSEGFIFVREFNKLEGILDLSLTAKSSKETNDQKWRALTNRNNQSLSGFVSFSTRVEWSQLYMSVWEQGRNLFFVCLVGFFVLVCFPQADKVLNVRWLSTTTQQFLWLPARFCIHGYSLQILICSETLIEEQILHKKKP